MGTLSPQLVIPPDTDGYQTSKRKSHYDLDEFKELVRQKASLVTRVTGKGAIKLGLSRYKEIILALSPQDFYKFYDII